MKLLAPTLFAMFGLVLGGCGGSDAVGAVKDWADKACKCPDKECADKMADEFNKIEHKYKKEFDDEKTADKADEHLERGNKCLEEKGSRTAG
jgi:hypothetical protein